MIFNFGFRFSDYISDDRLWCIANFVVKKKSAGAYIFNNLWPDSACSVEYFASCSFCRKGNLRRTLEADGGLPECEPR